MISAFKTGYLPWHAINKRRFLFNTISCNNESRAFKISFQFLSYIIFYHNILFINLLIFLLIYSYTSSAKNLNEKIFLMTCLHSCKNEVRTNTKHFLDLDMIFCIFFVSINKHIYCLNWNRIPCTHYILRYQIQNVVHNT